MILIGLYLRRTPFFFQTDRKHTPAYKASNVYGCEFPL